MALGDDEETDLPDELVVEIEGEPEILENEDGTVTLVDEAEEEAAVASAREWFSNIADTLDPYLLKETARDFLDRIAEDKQARQKRDEQYAEGLRRTGLGNDAPGGAQFLGASRAVHPMMAKATIDFAARVIKELLPPAGPVKTQIIPKADKALIAKAERKARHMNWQCTRQIREYRSELEQTLTQAPLGGAGYEEWSYDFRRKRPKIEFIPIDYVTLPFEAANIYTAERVTIDFKVDEHEFARRIDSGEYREVRITIPVENEPTRAEQANNKIEGVEPDGQNVDGVRQLYKVYARDIALGDPEAGDDTRPYILVIDQTDMDIVAVFRNWHGDDEDAQALDWLVEYGFIPWRGAYPIGLPHLIGSLSAAATGALRAALDAAHINNFPGMLKLKGGINGQNKNIEPTQITEIEGPPGVNDVRQIAMPLPFNPPSPMLFQLLQYVVAAADDMVRTSLDETADSNTNVPVGTTLARIEQGLVTYSAVFARMHEAQSRSLEILHRLNRDFLDDEQTISELGDLIVYREDYEGPLDVVPVSDPAIFSEQQRLQQAQLVVQRATTFLQPGMPPIYNPVAVEKYFLRANKVPDYESLLNEDHDASEVDPAEENARAVMGRPIRAYEEQDHDAHLIVHLAFLGDPSLGSNPLMATGLAPAMLGHIREHLAYRYKSQMDGLVESAAGISLERDDDEMEMDANERRQLETFQATSAVMVHNANMNKAPDYVQKIVPTLQAVAQAAQQGQQLMQMLMPPPPQQPDPGTAAMQAETQRKAQKDQADIQIAQQRQQSEDAREQARLQADQQVAQLQAQLKQRDQQIAELKIQAEDARAQADNATKLRINAEDNLTAKQIAAGEMITKERAALSTGSGINPNPSAR